MQLKAGMKQFGFVPAFTSKIIKSIIHENEC